MSNLLHRLSDSMNDVTWKDIQFKQELDNALNTLKNDMFPIGKIVIFRDNLDHSNYLGFTWNRCLAGRFTVGINANDPDFQTLGSQGGEKSHVLSTSEVPSLNSDGVPTVAMGSTDRVTGYGSEGSAHNNLPPYEVVSFWVRTA